MLRGTGAVMTLKLPWVPLPMWATEKSPGFCWQTVLPRPFAAVMLGELAIVQAIPDHIPRAGAGTGAAQNPSDSVCLGGKGR